MIRKLKPLGLALMALFALGAALASVASAQTQGKITSTGPVTLTGTQIAGQENKIEAFGAAPIRCPGSTYTAHKYNVTPHELIPNEATTTTVIPHLANCEVESANDTTVDLNGCDDVFHIGTTTATSTFAVTADFVCSGSNRVRVTKPGCDLEIGSQTGLSGTMVIKHTTGSADDVDLEGAFTNIKATTEAACLDLTTTTAVTTAHITITGHNELGEPTAVTVTD